jgi:hypothetical protein
MSVLDAILGLRRSEHREAVARRYALDAWLASIPEPASGILAATPKPEAPHVCQSCRACVPEEEQYTRMITCVTCGNKRCPKASNHALECTGSNAPGQKGSVYE